MKIFSPEYVTKEKGHGRIEVRKIRAGTALNEYVTFPYVAQVFRVDRITYKLNGELLRREVAYGITSVPPEKADLAVVSRKGHFNILVCKFDALHKIMLKPTGLWAFI